MRRIVVGIALLASAAGMLVGGCSAQTPGSPFAQSERDVWTLRLGPHVPFASGRFPLDSLARGSHGHAGLPRFRPGIVTPFSKFSPRLGTLFKAHPADTASLDVVVLFRERDPSPRLPLERVWAADEPPTRKAAMATLDSLRGIESRARAVWYRTQIRTLRTDYHAVVSDSFTLAQAVVARIRQDLLPKLAAWGEVRGIRLRRAENALPDCGEDGGDGTPIPIAAQVMGLDRLKQAGLMQGRLRLLDSGVDGGHAFFEGLPHVDTPVLNGPALVLHDCVADPRCSGLQPGDCQPCGHGTCSAGILVTARFVAPSNQGLTQAVVHSARIDPCAGGTSYDADAVERALGGFYDIPGKVGILEIAEDEPPEGTISSIADNAFREGVALVAAVGNTGGAAPEYRRAQAPANARGVLGVGARLGPDWTHDYDGQSYGGVADRTKPDLQAPTGTLTAKPGGGTRPYRATSGATPYAGAAALAVRNFLAQAAPVVDPGQVYSALLACGRGPGKGSQGLSAVRGVGIPSLPASGQAWFNAVSLGNGASLEIPFVVDDPSAQEIRMGAWWMDPPPIDDLLGGLVSLHLHADFDIDLLNAAGGVVATSAGPFGVFERLTYPEPRSTGGVQGSWRLRIRGRQVGCRPVKVYWTVLACPRP